MRKKYVIFCIKMVVISAVMEKVIMIFGIVQ